MGISRSRGWAYHSLGRAALRLGRLHDAERFANRVVEFSTKHLGLAPHAHQLLGDIAAEAKRFDPQRAETHYRQALTLAEPRGMRPVVAHCYLGLGKLSRRLRKSEPSRQHLATATMMYREMEMPFWLEQAEVP